jgi:hypothetical protein
LQNGKKNSLQKVGKDDLRLIYNFLVVNSLWPSGSPVQIWRDIHLAAQDSGALYFYYHYFNSSTQTETLAKAPEAPENSL